MNRIRGRRVLITGASAGIGEACARAFAERGAHLVLVARRLDRLHALEVELRESHGVGVEIAQVDVTDRASVDAFASTLEGADRIPDVLINNAGLGRGFHPFHEGEVEDWEEMIDTNLKGLLHVTRAVLPGMAERGSGHVVNIGSLAGHEVYPGGNVYCATKFGVEALTRALRLDLMGTGVRVSSVDPGMVDTEFSTVRFHGDQKRAAAVYRGLQPLTAADVADAVLYCVTRPPHVNIQDILMTPTAQASATAAHRSAD
jgi:serine 3-dehydrogenase